MPNISVCIATYNGEKYIKEQLESILCQLDTNDEIIISDDCSTDSTLKIIASFKDTRIVIIGNERKFKNHNFNFENALRHSIGDVIFMADQDDIWKENKVECFLNVFKGTNADLVISDCILVDDKKNIILDSYFKKRNSGNGFLKNFYKNTYTGCCMAFNRKVLNASLPFPKDTFSHDSWIGLIGEIVGKTYFLPEQLMYFRRHGKNFSTHTLGDSYITNKSSYSIFGSLKLRFLLIKMLFFRFLQLKIKK